MGSTCDRLWLIVGLSSITACGASHLAGADGGAPAGTDAERVIDATTSVDAGPADAGPPEAGPLLDEYTDAQVAHVLNQRGLRNGSGELFNAASVQWVRWSTKLPSLKDRPYIPHISQPVSRQLRRLGSDGHPPAR